MHYFEEIKELTLLASVVGALFAISAYFLTKKRKWIITPLTTFFFLGLQATTLYDFYSNSDEYIEMYPEYPVLTLTI
jgi:hypothetical protein